MLYAKWRWRNRLTRWLFDDPRMDQSIAEPLQSMNHLAFSPQFYFVESYYSLGISMMLLGVTICIRWAMNPFDDPALCYFIVQQLLSNRILDYINRFMVTQLIWKPKANNLFQVFSRTVELTLKRRDQHDAQERYRKWFTERHRPWLVTKLDTIFTPWHGTSTNSSSGGSTKRNW